MRHVWTSISSSSVTKEIKKPVVLLKIGSERMNYPYARFFNYRKFGHMQAVFLCPKRPPGACFKYFETTHLYRDCPLRRQADVIQSIHQVADPSQQIIEEYEILNLEHEVATLQMVSVTFPFIDNRRDSNMKLNLLTL